MAWGVGRAAGGGRAADGGRQAAPFKGKIGTTDPPDPPVDPWRPQNPDFSIFYGCFRGPEHVHSLRRPSEMNFPLVDARFPFLRSESG